MRAMTTATARARGREEAGDATQRHGGLGELGAVGGVDPSRSAATAATAGTAAEAVGHTDARGAGG